jgi:peptidoglycan hydrolase-like protein with peptidoglycan-binding domain
VKVKSRAQVRTMLVSKSGRRTTLPSQSNAAGLRTQAFWRVAQAVLVFVAIVATNLLTSNVAYAAPSRSFPGCPVLREGQSAGDCVVKLQEELNAVNPKYNLKPDGKFGEGTRIAVLDFQGRNHLGADGIVGAKVADTLQRQYDAIPTVDSPRPGTPTSGNPCWDIGLSGHEAGKCFHDGLTAGGRSAFDCLGQSFRDLTTGQIAQVHQAYTTFYAQGLRSRALYDAVSKKLGPAIMAGRAFKCAWWDLPSN